MEIEHRIEFMPPCLLRVSPHDWHLWFWGTNILWVGGVSLVLMAQGRGSVSLIHPCGPSHSLSI